MIIAPDGLVKLCDFGLARVVAEGGGSVAASTLSCGDRCQPYEVLTLNWQSNDNNNDDDDEDEDDEDEDEEGDSDESNEMSNNDELNARVPTPVRRSGDAFMLGWLR